MSSSSRQTSAAPSPLANEMLSTPSTRATSVASPAPPPNAARDCWIDGDGKPGPGFLSSESVVQSLMKGYKAYFSNPLNPDDLSFDPHPTLYPYATLEYPNTGASERFILLAPKDKDHYNPIMCLESSLHVIIEYYLTPAQRTLFGTLPTKDLSDEDLYESEFPPPASHAPSPPTSIPSPSSDSSATTSSSQSSQCSFSSFSSDSSASSLSSLSCISALSSYATRRTPSSSPSVDYLRLLQRAIHKHDGPLFLKVMDAINALLALFKYPPLPDDPWEPAPPNQLRSAVISWTEMPQDVVQRVIDETYQRAVGPHVHKLTRYEAFSSEVYGELMPTFVSDIVHATGLREGMLFLDLGAGVGNVVLQAALETGCRAYGVEIMPEPAKIARSQVEQSKMRCNMWGVRMGEVELEEGDMLKSEKVDRLVKEADVVLVNNKVFLEPLNEALKQKFLDLKEGAIVVSLKCLMGSGRTTARNGITRERSASPALKERNLNDISELFTVTSRPYYPGSVSWGGGAGEYFLQRMNRKDYARRYAQVAKAREGVGRSTRSRR
ncbi:DOT1-domain-containing protein [Trametes versicolor FP-101664 SS1]|uniref:DOT1-domain-containing protein n=1 Tax=Trametes versicolor (strain FP-101664) TaxID=717944 RepID=UPI0004622384|nr:DOT1-domain-containing protein [Trametes versicolor FP-101664 SS1]EIW65294.1 DOT1-domain-containing protein [Trametes versicolor FP-101664 SS1]